MGGDCAALVAALGSSVPDFSEFGWLQKIIEITWELLVAAHVYFEANCVAHRLAHIASCSSINNFWIDETSSIIEDVLMRTCVNVIEVKTLRPPRST